MISDTLSEAIGEIEAYEASLPHVYRDFFVEIGKVKTVMNALQAYFDCPYGGGQFLMCDTALERLKTAIANINVDALVMALDNLKATCSRQSEMNRSRNARKTVS